MISVVRDWHKLLVLINNMKHSIQEAFYSGGMPQVHDDDRKRIRFRRDGWVGREGW